MDAQWFRDMFILTLPLAEKILRPVIVYFFLIIGLRLAGKRELAQLNPFDLIVLLTIANTVQNAIIGQDNSVTGGLVGATALLLTNYGVVRFLHKHPKLQKAIEGQETFLIKKNKIDRAAMKKEVITLEELQTAARKQGYPSLDLIETATLDPGGAVSFVPQDPAPEEIRHQELVDNLEKLSKQIAALKKELAKSGQS